MTSTDAYTVHTQHGVKRTVRKAHFADFDSALIYGESISPDTDGTMLPNVDDKLAHHPRYEKGLFWFGNKYGVITKNTAT